MDIKKKYRRSLKVAKEGTPKIDVKNQYAWELSRIATAEALSIAQSTNSASEKLKYKRGLADSYRTIAQCFWLTGDFSTALSNLELALALYKKLEVPSGEAEIMNLYGGVYSNMSDYKKAITYYEFALTLRTEIGDQEGVVKSMNSIGDSLMKLKKFNEALIQFQSCLEKEHSNEMFKGIVLYNISEVYYHLGYFEKAEVFIAQCASIGKKLDFALMKIYCKSLLGKIEIKKEEYLKAIMLLSESLELARNINNDERVFHILEDLSIACELVGEPIKALEYFKEYHFTKEKVLNNESSQKLKTIEQRLETERLKDETEKEKQKNLELKKAYNIIEESRSKITVQNEEITDSIKYAQRIQEAILPSEQYIKSLMPDSFVMYRPKDVLSGDFYWVSDAVTNKKEKFILAAVADCTGHGVPGALMSIIGNNYLRMCEKEPTVNCPADALDFINVGISKTLRQEITESTVKDGMDMSFIALDYKVMKLYFAAAKSSILLIRNGEITRHKGDSHPVGAYVGEQLIPFTNHEIDVKVGDIIYLYSDGYIDQFGGENGKKFMGKRFRELLVSISSKRLREQKMALENAFDNWRGALEQLDDVCVMGIRV